MQIYKKKQQKSSVIQYNFYPTLKYNPPILTHSSRFFFNINYELQLMNYKLN